MQVHQQYPRLTQRLQQRVTKAPPSRVIPGEKTGEKVNTLTQEGDLLKVNLNTKAISRSHGVRILWRRKDLLHFVASSFASQAFTEGHRGVIGRSNHAC